MDSAAQALRDALYVTVGLGVITFQRAQVRRQELRKQFATQLDDARDQVTRLSRTVEDRVKLVEERLEDVEDQVERLLDTIEERLPEQARDVVRTARDAAKDARGQLRSLSGRNGTAA